MQARLEPNRALVRRVQLARFEVQRTIKLSRMEERSVCLDMRLIHGDAVNRVVIVMEVVRAGAGGDYAVERGDLDRSVFVERDHRRVEHQRAIDIKPLIRRQAHGPK